MRNGSYLFYAAFGVHRGRVERKRRRSGLTSDAGVRSFEVRHELLGAWVIGVQRGVGNGELARTASRAAPVEMRQHVGRAPDAAVVLPHAAAEPHPAVAR